MRNDNGFTLIEVLAALAILMMTTATAVPVLIQVYQERQAIREEQQAFEALSNHIQLVLLGEEAPVDQTIERNGLSYEIIWHDANQESTAKACISWTGSHERRVERCGFVKIPLDLPSLKH